jgi:hypothetical protein
MSKERMTLGALVCSLQNVRDEISASGTTVSQVEGITTINARLASKSTRLLENLRALKALDHYLGVKSDIPVDVVANHLSVAQSWLMNELTNWSPTSLGNLDASVSSMIDSIRSILAERWSEVLKQVQRARTLLSFIGDGETSGLLARSRLFDFQTTTLSMIDAIDFLQEAEKLIEAKEYDDSEVQDFLERAASPDGAPLEVLVNLKVKDWLNQDQRDQRFVIRFKD